MSICFEKTYQRAFGTYPLKGDVLRDAVAAALEVGYRAFERRRCTGTRRTPVRPLRPAGSRAEISAS